MTAKQYLRQIRVLDSRIRVLSEEIEEQFALATRITPVLDKLNVQSSNGNTKEDAVLRYIESTVKLDSLLKLAESQRATILQQVISLDDQRYIDVLYHRYFLFESWEDLCEATNISRRNVFRIHSDALIAFEKMALNGT